MVEGPAPEYTHMFTNAAYKESVYPPSEDSFLLLDAIADDIREGRSGGGDGAVVELGCGSGYVLAGVALAGGGRTYVGIDVNAVACAATAETWAASGLDSGMLEVVEGDGAEAVLPRLAGQADMVIFNPPYVPTPSDEIGVGGLAASWAGGVDGREVLDRVLPGWLALLAPHGTGYLLLLEQNKPADVAAALAARGFAATRIADADAGTLEALLVFRIERAPAS